MSCGNTSYILSCLCTTTINGLSRFSKVVLVLAPIRPWKVQLKLSVLGEVWMFSSKNCSILRTVYRERIKMNKPKTCVCGSVFLLLWFFAPFLFLLLVIVVWGFFLPSLFSVLVCQCEAPVIEGCIPVALPMICQPHAIFSWLFRITFPWLLTQCQWVPGG